MFVSLSRIYLGVSALMSRRNPHGSCHLLWAHWEIWVGKALLPSPLRGRTPFWPLISDPGPLLFIWGSQALQSHSVFFLFGAVIVCSFFHLFPCTINLGPLVPNSSVENLRLPAPVTDEAVQEEASRLPGLLSITRHFSPPCFSEKSFSPFPLLTSLPPPSKPALQMLMLQRALIGILLSPPTPQQTQQVPR